MARESQDRVTLKVIADRLGYSQQTISMALRNHPRISKSTKEKIRNEAAQLGYTPDPALTALARYRTQQRQTTDKWDQVALVHDWKDIKDWTRYPLYRRLNAALQAEAAERGIQLMPFWVGKDHSRKKGVFQNIYNRGIRGVLVAPPSDHLSPHPISLPKTNFHIVTFGPAHTYADQHVVQFDYYENLRLAWRKLWEAGYRRIGLANWNWTNWRTGEAFVGAYLAEKEAAAISSSELQPCVITPGQESEFKNWIQKEQPDALITIIGEASKWVQESGNNIPVVLLSVNNPGETGVDVNPSQAAKAAFELLLLEMHRSLTQQSGSHLRILIPGKWVSPAQ